MSHNPGYRQPNTGWTDRGIDIGPLNDIRQRVQQVAESILSAEMRVSELQEENGKMKDTIDETINRLEHILTATQSGQSVERADIESLLSKLQNVQV